MKIKKSTFIYTILLLCVTFANKSIFATNDVIMILDPEQDETIEKGSGPLVASLLYALQEKVAPIIVSTNLLEFILHLKQQIGDNDLQRLRTMIVTTTNADAMVSAARQLCITHGINDKDAIKVAILSIIDFYNGDIQYYFHKKENLVLLIPKQYILKNKPLAAHVSWNDQVKTCGFNGNVVVPVLVPVASELQKQLDHQKSISVNREEFLANLMALFIPKKEEDKWVIYIEGHGQMAESDEKSQIMPETAYIAGLSFNEFKSLMEFFNKDLNVGFVHYTTCFGGGWNQTAVNKILSSLNVNFIVSAEGIDETSTYGMLLKFVPSSNQKGLVVSQKPFSEFFGLLRLFIDQPEEFVRSKGERGKDPVATILRAIVPNMKETNQPFVRFPSIGVFGALALEKNVKILTQAIVKAREIEKKPIDLSNTEVTDLIVYPPRINIPLNLGKKMRSIVSPTSQAVVQSNEVVHIFREVNFDGTMQDLLFSLVWRNARLHTQTFIIKKLTGILYDTSHFLGDPNKKQPINNLIVQIKGIVGTNYSPEPRAEMENKTPLTAQDVEIGIMGANVEVAFELNGNIYQALIPITIFERDWDKEVALHQKALFSQNLYDEFKVVSFAQQPVKDVNMAEFAQKFLTSQEIMKIKKPITLDSITTFIDSKIDRNK